MKPITIAIAVCLAWTASAHWTYEQLIHVVGEQYVVSDPYTYIRRQHQYGNTPVADPGSPEMRCGELGLTGSNTGILSVNAGDKLGFIINPRVIHPSVMQVYVSKVPNNISVKDYTGSGPWIRIHSITTEANATNPVGMAWATMNKSSFLFTLPRALPAAEYLVRVEGIALHLAATYLAEYFVGCAQVQVANNITSWSSDMTAFEGYIPGVYNDERNHLDMLKVNIYETPAGWTYTSPGPALWPVGTVDQHAVKLYQG